MSHSNTVQLLGTYGGDRTHALSAWTSTSRDLDKVEKSGKKRSERIPGLLKMLAEQGHHTPFEKSAIHFLITCDKATHIQLLKHRVGVSVNGESARYKELKDDKWYTPSDWPQYLQDAYNENMAKQHSFYHMMLENLEREGLDRKRAKESARMVLPHASQITQDVQFNFRSLMHFAGLRAPEDAQYEVRYLTAQMLAAVWFDGSFKISLESFGWTEDKIDDLLKVFGQTLDTVSVLMPEDD